MYCMEVFKQLYDRISTCEHSMYSFFYGENQHSASCGRYPTSDIELFIQWKESFARLWFFTISELSQSWHIIQFRCGTSPILAQSNTRKDIFFSHVFMSVSMYMSISMSVCVNIPVCLPVRGTVKGVMSNSMSTAHVHVRAHAHVAWKWTWS